MFGQPSTPFASPPAAASTPFGAAPAPAFGATGATPAPFGTTATPAAGGGFGGFGSPPATAAPATGGFGGFGAAPAPAAGGTGFGGFGAPAAAPGTSAFGAPSGTSTPFGAAPAPGGGLFGGGAAAGTATGGGGLFGGGTTTGTTGAFGAPAPAPGGFGGFGTAGAPTTSAFGGNPGTSTFGAPAPSTGLFGGGATAAPAFGAATSGAATSAFGAPAAAPGAGLFGAAPAAGAGGGLFGSPATAAGGAKPGTLSSQYQVTPMNDGASSISIQAITAMQPYESKSFEELRLEDYGAGNRGSQGQQQPGQQGAGGFGGFGAAAAPAPAPGFFGAPAPAPGGGLFGGAPAPAPGGLFGSSAPAPAGGLFGGSAAPAPAGGLFGSAPAPAPGLFGAPAPAPAGGLFGSTPAPAPGGLFGSTPAPAPGGLFGAPAAAATATAAPATGLFGAPAQAPGLFGSKSPAPAPGLFSAPSAPAAGTGLFGAPAAAPAGGLFGAPAAAAPAPFGAPAAPTAAPLFGAPTAAAPGGLFGSTARPPAGGGLFGTPAPAPAPGGGLFSSLAPAAPATPGGGLFGSPSPAHLAAPLATSHISAALAAPNAEALLVQQLAAVEQQKKELAALEAWRGNPPSGSSVIPSSVSERDAFAAGADGAVGRAGMSSYATSSGGALLSYQAAPRSAAKIRPRGFGPVKSPSPAGCLGGGGGGSSVLSPDTFLGSSTKRLVIKPGSLTPKPKMRLVLTDGDGTGGSPQIQGGAAAVSAAPALVSNESGGRIQTSPAATSPPGRSGDDAGGTAVARDIAAAAGAAQNVAHPNTPNAASDSAPLAVSTPRQADGEERAQETPGSSEGRQLRSALKKTASPDDGFGYDFYRQVVASPEEKDHSSPPAAPTDGHGEPILEERIAPTASVPKLTKADYDVKPSMEALSSMSEVELATVSGFCVERVGVGAVAWDGAVDVRGIDLDSVVSIEPRDVAVYDAEEAGGNKPPVGSKLNRPAVITMYEVFPKDGRDASAEAKEKFERKIVKSTRKMGADLLSYDSTGGVWKFRVNHFSRYNLLDDSDDDDDDEDNDELEKKTTSAPHQDSATDFILAGTQRPTSPPLLKATHCPKSGGRSRIRAPFSEDEEMSERTEDDSVALVSEGESSGGGHESRNVMEAAEAAYAMMQANLKSTYSGGKTAARDSHDKDEVERNVTLFAEEGEAVGEYVIPSLRSCLDSSVAVTRKVGKVGICSQIAAKCGVRAPTSTSTDFGMRMGRSFRVGWRPDGTLVHPLHFGSKANTSSGPANGVLTQSRPVLRDRIAEASNSEGSDSLHPHSFPLLETHLAHSNKFATALDDCPVFSLPRSVGSNGGAESSSKAVCNLLDDYARSAKPAYPIETDPEISLVVSRAFSLLGYLYGQEEATLDRMDQNESQLLLTDVTASKSERQDGSSSAERRWEGIMAWLREATAHDVVGDVAVAERRSDVHSAIFAALSGGDRSKACAIAARNRYLRLSLLLANTGSQGGSELRHQIQLWHDSGASSHIPSGLLRIYTLLSGDLGAEESIFKQGGTPAEVALDWRRRLGMFFWCHCAGVDNERPTVSSTIQQYESQVAVGVAPYPIPRYLPRTNHQVIRSGVGVVRCLLYRLLRHYAGGSEKDRSSSLSHIVSPNGHTASVHDFSMAFHLAAVMSALGCCPPLEPLEEARLADSYVAQLVEAGHWEWAVYVVLCRQGGEVVSTGGVESMTAKAKELVLRYFTDDIHADSLSPQRRSFLENDVGIPSTWFEEALAARCAYAGDAFGYVSHFAQVSPGKAAEAVEEAVLPSLLFKGRTAVQEYMHLLEFLGHDDENSLGLCGDVFDLIRLSDEVLRLSQLSKIELGSRKERIRILEVGHEAKILQDKMSQREANLPPAQQSSRMPSRFAGLLPVPRSSFIAEAFSALSFLRVQLRALEAGCSIIEEQRMHGKPNRVQLKMASQLAFVSSTREESESSSSLPLGSGGVLRGIL